MTSRPVPSGRMSDRAPDVLLEAPVADSTRDCRCGCGSLLARLRPGGVELKCRRCKRVVVLPLAALSTCEVCGARTG
jgi:phage FluMu protein Com